MAFGEDAIVELPDGKRMYGPAAPRTWAADERYRAKQLSQSVAAAVAWHRNRPFFQALQLNSGSLAASSWGLLPLEWEMIDQWGGHSDSASPWLWYVPYTENLSTPSDYYLCSGYVPMFATDTTKVAIAGIIKNGSDIREGMPTPYSSSHAIDSMVIDLVGASGGDTLSLGAWTNLVGGNTTVVSGKCPSLTVRWVGSGAGTVSALPGVPHTWIDADQVTATATGASPRAGGSKVPLNAEIRDLIRFLNYPPLARLTSTGTSQTIPSGASTWTSINFTATANNIDTFTGWVVGTPAKYTIPRSGVYFLAGYVAVAEAGTNTGYRASRLLINSATPYGGGTAIPQSTGTTGTGMYAVRQLRLTAGDTVEVQMQHNQGANLSVKSAAGNAAKLIAVWLSR